MYLISGLDFTGEVVTDERGYVHRALFHLADGDEGELVRDLGQGGITLDQLRGLWRALTGHDFALIGPLVTE